jgi:hypothetical protein
VAAKGAAAKAAASTNQTGPSSVSISREVFGYDAGKRRDPFVSLAKADDMRPVFTDLRLVGIAYDPLGRSSVAVMRDVASKELYRVRVGNTVGRARVTGIAPKAVTFALQEFGVTRQETMTLRDTTRKGMP